MTDEVQPWERQPGESAQAWEAFQLYRDTEGKRGLPGVAQQLAKTLPLIKRWSARWSWGSRVRAWDAELDREYRRERLRERARVGRLHARQAEALRGIAVREFQALSTRPAGSMSPRDALEFMKASMAAEADLFGLGEGDDAADSGVRIVIDGRLLPPPPAVEP